MLVVLNLFPFSLFLFLVSNFIVKKEKEKKWKRMRIANIVLETKWGGREGEREREKIDICCDKIVNKELR